MRGFLSLGISSPTFKALGNACSGSTIKLWRCLLLIFQVVDVPVPQSVVHVPVPQIFPKSGITVDVPVAQKSSINVPAQQKRVLFNDVGDFVNIPSFDTTSASSTTTSTLQAVQQAQQQFQ